MKNLLLLLFAGLALAALAREPGLESWRREMAVRDSLRHLPPNMRFYYLQEGWQNRAPTPSAEGTFGLRLLGKWGAGPSVKVTGRDSLVFLSRGSEVVVVNFADTANPRILSYIQVNGLVSRSVLVGNRLYVGTTGSDPKYIEVFDVSSPASPVKLGEVQTRLSDIDVVDTLVYVIARDSLRVFSFADPANPRQVGACRDSGYDISVCNGYAYVGDRWGLYVLDATNPASPHRIASWGNDVISVKARNTIVCVTTGNPNQPDELNFSILDVRVPSAPYRIGYLVNAGAYDMFLAETLAFLSGYYTGGHVFRILDISDSTQPTLIGSSPTPGEHMGVWARLPAARAYVADRFKGLTVMNIGSLNSPVVDTSFLGAGIAEDVCVDGNRAYVAGSSFGMTILDVSDPARPIELGYVDSTRNMVSNAVAARDSFACMGWVTHPWLRSIDVTDPSNPLKAGAVDLFNPAEDMVLRDSFLYIAEDNRFQVVNVARPRSPVLVGSCNLPAASYGMWLQDSLAFVTTWPMAIVNVANPSNPAVVGSIWKGAFGVCVKDTLAYVAGGDLFTYSVSDPASPYLVDSLFLGDFVSDVVVVDTLAYLGCDDGVRLLSVADPLNPRVLALCPLPYITWRLTYSEPYLYAVCRSAGVCVLESTMVGMEERPTSRPALEDGVIALPNPTTGRLSLTMGAQGRGPLTFRDAAGRQVLTFGDERALGGTQVLKMDVSALPPGIYFLEFGSGKKVVKVVKQ